VSASGIPADALALIWERHREGVRARLDTIEQATAGEVGPEALDEAVRAAHQLAGTVGTFGFSRATGMARELELRLHAPGTVTSELGALARELRHELIGESDGDPAPAPAERLRGRVLAVDDDPLILDTVQALLHPRGVEVLTESDPLRVVERLPEIAPDLLILDVDMPGIDGIELCRRVRAERSHQELRIVFLTTHIDSETIGAAYEAGADGHLSKPVVAGELVACVGRHLTAA
jgi:CheY-like chemotaxis protein